MNDDCWYDGPSPEIYRSLKRQLQEYLRMDPRDPDRPDEEEIEALKNAIEDCF